MKYISKSSEETENIGRILAESAKPGQIYCLSGELGIGKTVFSKGFAKGLGIDETITSPTFCILNEYQKGRLPFYHFDVYRIGSAEEMYDICYPDYFYGDGICLIEWAENIKELIPNTAIWILLEKFAEKCDNYREITIQSRG